MTDCDHRWVVGVCRYCGVRGRLSVYRLWSRVLPFALALVACASWEPTRNAIVRRQAEAQLRGCMSGTLCTQVEACIAESVRFCVDHGLERTCGTDAIYAQPIRCRLYD